MMALIVVSLIFIAQQADGLASISNFYLRADKLTGGKKHCECDFRRL